MSTTDDHTNRVLALLAKAESTEYPEEAETFFAKAQELMARHSIDEAMLNRGATVNDVTSVTIVCAAPYATSKAVLLTVIAATNHCTAVRVTRRGDQTMRVFGFGEDIGNVESLFVALSAHATREVLNATVPEWETPKAFRYAFLLGFAIRIGQRLEDAGRVARDGYETETGVSTALVLSERSVAVKDAMSVEYPKLGTSRTSASSRAGHAYGRAAADRADLGQRAVVGSRRALR